MSTPQELIIDSTTPPLIELSENILQFKINRKSLSEAKATLKDNTSFLSSETFLTIKNLSSHNIAVRSRTTKKRLYSVSPIYFSLGPHSEKLLRILLYLNLKEDISSAGHKFKFDSFIITEEEKNRNIKQVFGEYAERGQPVKGTIFKREVEFIFDDNYALPTKAPTNLFASTMTFSPRKNLSLHSEPFGSPSGAEISPEKDGGGEKNQSPLKGSKTVLKSSAYFTNNLSTIKPGDEEKKQKLEEAKNNYEKIKKVNEENKKKLNEIKQEIKNEEKRIAVPFGARMNNAVDEVKGNKGLSGVLGLLFILAFCVGFFMNKK